LIFDVNLGQTIDSVLALALLHGLAGKQECRVASLTINYPDLRAAQLCDVIERYYASAAGPGLGGFVPATAPIGIVESRNAPADQPLLAQTVALTNGENQKIWASGIKKWNDTAIPEILIRNILLANFDGKAAMVVSGPATNLASLLKLPDILPLISAKLKVMVIADGEFPSGKPDPGFMSDLPAAKRVLADWPTPIVFSGRELGNQIPFPGASVESAFSYNPAHPIAAAYRAAHEMPYDAPAPAMAAVLYAIRPKEGYFTLSEPGVVSVSNDGRTEFRPSADGRHRYLKADPAQRERVSKIYVEMASAKPAAPPPRRLPPALQKLEEERAAAAAGKKQQPPPADPQQDQQ
jgi:hypothetical protein